MENDEEREDDDLPPPDIEIDVLDNRRADIELRIVFVENIDLVPDDNGRVTFDGANYDVAPVPVTVPDEAAVGDDDSKPTDKPYVYEG